jgi:hypothetical protein
MTDWDDLLKVRMRNLTLLMRHSGLAINDALCLRRDQLANNLIISKRKKTLRFFFHSVSVSGDFRWDSSG